MWYRSNNGNTNRLMRQIEESEFEWREYGVPKIRYGSYEEMVYTMRFWDTPYRSDVSRNWKRHRKTQYK